MFDVAHGAGLAAVWGAWSRYVMDAAPARFARFARNVMGVSGEGSDSEIALAGIEAFETFLRSIQMPVTLGQLGVPTDDATLERLAWMCSYEGTRTIGTFKVLDLEDIKAIYHMAK
jgi:alcohol dehydrogenase YqhD (iron-dependent ADH family)